MTDRGAPVVTRGWPQRASVARASRAAMVGPGKGTGSGGGAGPVSGFPSVTGLFARFRADIGVTMDGSNLVGTWADQSGNGHDLSEATNKPLWQAAQVNGLPAILFDGVNDILLSGALVLPQPFTMLIIYKEIVHTSGKRIFSTATGPEFFMSSSSETAIVIPGVVGAYVIVGTTNFALLTGVANGVSSTIALNDGVPQTDTDDLTGSGSVLALGSDGTNFSNVNVAELVVLSGAVSAPDKTALLSYFRTTYGLW